MEKSLILGLPPSLPFSLPPSFPPSLPSFSSFFLLPYHLLKKNEVKLLFLLLHILISELEFNQVNKQLNIFDTEEIGNTRDRRATMQTGESEANQDKQKQGATDLPPAKLECQERRQVPQSSGWGHLTQARTTDAERNMEVPSFLLPFRLPHSFQSQGNGACRDLPSRNTDQAGEHGDESGAIKATR